MTDAQVLDAMETLGGNFIRHLARAFVAADPVNQERLKAAFEAEWRRYAELAAIRAAREMRER